MNGRKMGHAKKIKVDIGSPLDQWQSSCLHFYLAIQKDTDAV